MYETWKEDNDRKRRNIKKWGIHFHFHFADGWYRVWTVTWAGSFGYEPVNYDHRTLRQEKKKKEESVEDDELHKETKRRIER